MDLDDVESILLNALAGADNVVVNDVSGTDSSPSRRTTSRARPAAPPATARRHPDVRGTGGNDQVDVTGDAPRHG